MGKKLLDVLKTEKTLNIAVCKDTVFLATNEAVYKLGEGAENIEVSKVGLTDLTEDYSEVGDFYCKSFY